MNGLDIAGLVIIGLSVLIGLWRGLVFELMSLLGWLLAYGVAMAFAPTVGPYLPIGEPGSPLNQAAAVVTCFVGTVIVWAVLSRLVRTLIRGSPLTPGDRALGAIFGLARAVLLLLVLATAVALTPAAKSPLWQQSVGAQWLGILLDGIAPALPQPISRWLPSGRATPR